MVERRIIRSVNAEERLRAEVTRAALAIGAPEGFEPVLERPREHAHGDWATTAALVLAKALRRKPADISRDLVAALDATAAGVAESAVAGPGFINFRLDAARLAAGLHGVLAQGRAFGRGNTGAGRAVNVEFVSANPTGPLHVGHGRQAALGDAISALLAHSGWKVTREFYYNDGGGQIERLRDSVHARIVGAPLADDQYHGEYVKDVASAFVTDLAPRLGVSEAEAVEHVRRRWRDDAGLRDDVRRFAVAYLRAEQDADLKAFGVAFDVYYLESSLYSDGKVASTIEALKATGHTFELDGATWLRTTDFGDDKDRVMVRSAGKGGEPTYFVPDVAYHVTKWERGFTRAVDVQGADHHSTVTRVRAGLQALGIGIPQGYPEYVLHQMVTVVRGGEEVKISKRAGSYVTVRDLVDEVGRDAVRYFFLMRKGESQLVFDVDLARSQSEENPVYYIQMAHARLSGIFRVGGISAESVTGESVDWGQLGAPEERELVKAILDWPSLAAGAAEALEPHRVAGWLLDTARLVHLWYHKHHVLGEPEPVMRARLALASAARITLANALGLLGIAAPERM
ncbi:MAG: arginine--tRNA ligase [Gemmatimonadaceae bacterium]|nr:arginine--tRNA ligase [Gemmatimonadaceae bacterium]